MEKFRLIVTATCFMPAYAGLSQAQPQEAIDACSGRSQGDACQVNTPRDTLRGTGMAAGTTRWFHVVPRTVG